MKPEPIPTRLRAATPGLGQPSETEIERRAIELAQSDGRDAFTDADLAQAAAELSGGDATSGAPAADASLEQVTSWDEPAAATGRRIDTMGLEDESSVAEQLIRDGLEEADHDLRVEAEEDRPDEDS